MHQLVELPLQHLTWLESAKLACVTWSHYVPDSEHLPHGIAIDIRRWAQRGAASAEEAVKQIRVPL